jgi:hypothetical protein
MASNGRLTSAELSPIAGGGYLRRDAAAAWNAMAAEARKRGLGNIAVKGPDSAYRTYDRQVYWRSYWCSRGVCGNAAVPGTSNHGWGIAVDIDTWVVNVITAIGSEFGWRKACSDALWEPWHYKWCGGWSGADSGTGGTGGTRYPTLKKGMRGKAVKRAQRHLRRWNLGITRPTVDGGYGAKTKYAVKQFQWNHGLRPDGVLGKQTWARLRTPVHLTDKELAQVNKLRWRQRKGIRPKERAQAKAARAWLVQRLDQMKRDGDKGGKKWWDKNHRRKRFSIIKKTVKRTWR